MCKRCFFSRELMKSDVFVIEKDTNFKLSRKDGKRFDAKILNQEIYAQSINSIDIVFESGEDEILIDFIIEELGFVSKHVKPDEFVIFDINKYDTIIINIINAIPADSIY